MGHTRRLATMSTLIHELVKTLEEQRKVEEQAYYLEKKAKTNAIKKAVATVDLSAVKSKLEKFAIGY